MPHNHDNADIPPSPGANSESATVTDQAPTIQQWHAEEGVDTAKPEVSRVMDYVLGGGANFHVDRELAAQLNHAPGLDYPAPFTELVRASHNFRERAVRFLLDKDIRQYLVLGSGVSTVGNPHQIVQASSQNNIVLYVDIDPIAVATFELLVDRSNTATVIRADLRDTRTVLDHHHTQQLIDLDLPVGLIVNLNPAFIDDADDPAGIIAAYRDALSDGSALVLAHATADHNPHPTTLAEIFRTNNITFIPRSRDQIASLFRGWDLVEPDLVPTPLWHPVHRHWTEPLRSLTYGAVGLKRGIDGSTSAQNQKPSGPWTSLTEGVRGSHASDIVPVRLAHAGTAAASATHRESNGPGA